MCTLDRLFKCLWYAHIHTHVHTYIFNVFLELDEDCHPYLSTRKLSSYQQRGSNGFFANMLPEDWFTSGKSELDSTLFDRGYKYYVLANRLGMSA